LKLRQESISFTILADICTVGSRIHRSKLNNGETGDFLEIANVQRRKVKSEMQRNSADQQVLNCELDPHRFLLTFDAPGSARDVERYRMHWHITRQSLDKFQPSLLLGLGLGATGSRSQLGDGHHG
jgi:hypothetical protein